MHACSVCSRSLLLNEEFHCCAVCGSAVHRACRPEADNRCPRCGGPVPANPFFAPVTPGYDVALALTGGLTLILFFVAAAVLNQIPFGKDAPGTAGIAFYFFFVPIALLTLLAGALFGLIWYLRRQARRPRRTQPQA